MKPVSFGAATLLSLATALGACRGATGPSFDDLIQAQSRWASHHLTRYAYRYTSFGFFNTIEGQPLRLVVLGDTVRSAQFVATNDSVPVPPGTLPTIDGLFAIAMSAWHDGRLTGAEFDPDLGFPTRIDIAGPPDAAGSLTASGIEFLP